MVFKRKVSIMRKEYARFLGMMVVRQCDQGVFALHSSPDILTSFHIMTLRTNYNSDFSVFIFLKKPLFSSQILCCSNTLAVNTND